MKTEMRSWLIVSEDLSFHDTPVKASYCYVCFSDGDGNIDLLLPVCTTDFCEESHIYVYSSGQVHVHLITTVKTI